jgi:hypothetical protein
VRNLYVEKNKQRNVDAAVWQNSSINTRFLIEHSLICSAEKMWMKETK